MRYSKLFGKTVREARKDMQFASHKLLYQAGYVRESVAGRYFILPLAMRVRNKFIKIIAEEMDAKGGQQMLSPTLHPMELWEETNRDNEAGFELMQVKDRRGAKFAIGGTAEEMFVDVMRKFNISYKDLPINIYQFSQKFRDEFRARGGLLRVREFTMKDAYSFDIDEEAFKKTYSEMADAYHKIFNRVGLDAKQVLADVGYIGGTFSHEFIVDSEVGESRYFVTENGKYVVHEDLAAFIKDEKNKSAELAEMKEVEAVRGTTMEDGAKLHDMPLWQQIKDVLYVNENGEFILAIIRGDYNVNEVKLMNITGANDLRPATEEEIREQVHSEPGFISPVGIKDNLAKDVKLLVVADDSLRTIINAYGGANALNRDLLNMNIDRDYKADLEGDIAMAEEGYEAPENNGKLIEKKGIEVGNLFNLEYHYSNKMNNATYVNEEGEATKYYMGSYGIGIGRTLAAIVEKHHDDKGIIWPEAIAPYQIHLIVLNQEQKEVNAKAEAVYKELSEAGVEVLFDERDDASAGEKLADADLIGIPWRVVISKKTGDKVEIKKRTEKESVVISVSDALKML